MFFFNRIKSSIFLFFTFLSRISVFALIFSLIWLTLLSWFGKDFEFLFNPIILFVFFFLFHGVKGLYAIFEEYLDYKKNRKPFGLRFFCAFNITVSVCIYFLYNSDIIFCSFYA